MKFSKNTYKLAALLLLATTFSNINAADDFRGEEAYSDEAHRNVQFRAEDLQNFETQVGMLGEYLGITYGESYQQFLDRKTTYAISSTVLRELQEKLWESSEDAKGLKAELEDLLFPRLPYEGEFTKDQIFAANIRVIEPDRRAANQIRMLFDANEAEAKRLATELAAAQAQVATIAGLTADKDNAEAEAKRLAAELAAATSKASGDIASLTADKDNAEAEAKRLATELAAAQQAIAKLTADLDAATKDATAADSKAKADAADAAKIIAELQAKLLVVKTAADDKGLELAATKSLSDGFKAARDRAIAETATAVLEKDATLARITTMHDLATKLVAVATSK